MAGTRPKSIKTEETETFPRIIHEIDQFDWYKDIIDRTTRKKNDDEELNSIRFILPYTLDHANPYLVITGSGFNLCEIYVVRVNWGRGDITREIPKEKSGLWKIFSYNKEKFPEDGLDALKESLPSKLGSIFVTDISPFLKGGNYPLECDRIYNFPLWDFDRLSVIARNRENKKEENLELIFIPGGIKEKTETIVTLPHLKWTSSLDNFPFTDQFTFPHAVNTDSL